MKSHSSSEELLAIDGCQERTSVFFRDAGPERLPMFQHAPESINIQVTLNETNGSLAVTIF